MRWTTCLAVVTIAACSRAPEIDSEAYERDILAWRSERVERLTAEDGWLSLVGLHWLKEGDNRIGSAPGNDIVLWGSLPPVAATLELRADEVRLRTAPGVEMRSDGKRVEDLTLISDVDGAPTIVEVGDISFYTIQRGDRLGIRVKAASSPARSDFPGIDYFAIDPAWRVVARFEAFDPPRSMATPTVLGTIEQLPSPGVVVFRVGGETFRIDAQADSPAEDLFLIFGDATNGRDTYGGGRFLYVDPPDAQGRLVVDFNRSYNPPCAFTPYATCPLPPKQNRLDLPIEAGEKKYAGSTH